MVAASTAHGQIRNPGFEINDASNPDQPADWKLVGDGGAMRFDAAIKHDGERSLRLQKKPGATFTGVGQILDATPFRGEIIVLRGWMRAEKADGLAGLWLRADAADASHRGFVNDYQKPAAAWTRRQVMLDIGARAERIVFGAAVMSDDPIWVDSLEISVLDSVSATPLQGAANDYLEEALQIIRTNALYADRVDWAAATARAKLFASGATTPQEAHGAVRQLLRALNDHHSFLKPAAEVKSWRETTSARDFGIGSAAVANKGYVRVPGFSGVHAALMRAFADDLAARIAAQREAGSCGWIVDLRDDTGGNMDPMLAGLGALLGVETLGYFVGKGERHRWSLQRFYDSTGAPPPAQWPLTEAPVAVLTGPRTASSGEAVVISFRGRPRTRFFGSSTSGLTTANRGFTLSDGSMILLAVSREADRTGKIYDTAIAPDEVIQTLAPGAVPGDDPVVQAAAGWLDTQEPCRR